MRPEDRDAGYVWDMLDAARTIRDFTAGVALIGQLDTLLPPTPNP